ncbi:MAG: ice-binding family protein [Anaerolineaceae bacterium]|nr:ice-binding family protein [Anaerolineaceae bacterium]
MKKTPKLKTLAVFLVMFITISLLGSSLNVSARKQAALSPVLVASERFSVLAETTITNIPTSSVGRDVGLSPASGSAIGLTAAEVGGMIYAVDGFGPAGSVVDPALLTQVISDMMSAYGYLDQGCDTTYPGVQDLTLVSPLIAGTYCADAFLLTGNLTLEGTGVWIFKTPGTLTTSAGSSVTGGDPCNVWWRLGTAADLFENSSIIGTILAGTSINLRTGATLNGRAFAQAAVTLDQNTITGLICRAVPTATLLPFVTALPDTGGAPLNQTGSFSWGLGIIGLLCVAVLIFGIRAIRKTDRSN